MTKALQQATTLASFLNLADTPDSYSGQANKLIGVNGAANALEFKTAITTMLGLTDVPDTYVAGASLKVNAAGTGFEYGTQMPRYTRNLSEAPGGTNIFVSLPGVTVWGDIFRTALPTALAAGDLLIAMSEFEVENPSTITVEIVTGMLLSSTPVLSSGVDAGGSDILLGHLNGHNVTPIPNGMHYYNTPRVGMYMVQTPIATPYVHVRARCRSSDATGSENCVIKTGYGHCSVIVIPKAGL